MRRALRWLAVLALASTGAYAASFDLNRLLGAGRDLLTAASGVEEKEEIEVGREITGRMLGAAPLVADDALQTYVNQVGRWVAMQSERPDLPWRFGVIDSPSINAFAAPGGYVLVTRGLYEILDSEAQLAAVLGHEIAHVVQRHHINVMRKTAAISAGAQLAQVRERSELVGRLIGTGAEVFARALDKDAEFEADRLGLVLAARAGYSFHGLIEVLHKLSARGAGDASLALLFKTHPHPGERLSRLGDALAPRVAELPAGREPAIQPVSASAAPVTRPRPAAAGPTEQAEPPPSGGSGFGIDPGRLLRGLIGR